MEIVNANVSLAPLINGIVLIVLVTVAGIMTTYAYQTDKEKEDLTAENLDFKKKLGKI